MRELYDDRPAEGWLDGLPLGNGRLGAMALAGRDGLRLQLNDGTAWSGGTASEHRRGGATPDQAAAALAEARALIAAGRPREAEREMEVLQGSYSQAYLPFADLVLRGAWSSKPVTRRLVLAEAVHRARYGEHAATEADGGAGVEHETFVSAVDGVLVHHVRSTDPVDLVLELGSPLRTGARHGGPDHAALELHLPADVAPGHEPEEPPLRWEVPGVTPLAGAVGLAWEHDGTTAPRTEEDGTVLHLTGVRSLRLVVATRTTFTGVGSPPAGTAGGCAEEAVAAARTALRLPDLRDRHVAAHRALVDRVELSLGPDDAPPTGGRGPAASGPVAVTTAVPTAERVRRAHDHPDGPLAADPDLLALLVDYGRYLLLSASRPGGLPVTLQGLWNEQMQPPWSSNYTVNINTEMSYWAAGVLDLAECLDPLLDLVEGLARHGAATAARLYGARGWVTHHNTDAWAFTSPTAGDASWSQWPLGGVWLVRHLDELRRFGAASPAQLERLWVVAAGAAEFACDWLTEDEDGALVTRPSTSPENRYRTAAGPAAVTTGSAMDLTLVAELFRAVQALAEELGHQDVPVVAEVGDALPRLRGLRVEDGAVVEWSGGEVAVDADHRHVSHLSFLHPGDGAPGADLAAAASRSLDLRGDDSTGWSLMWKACLRARLGQGAKVEDLLRLALRPAGEGSGPYAGGLYANLFAAHPPFQIDGNLGLPAAVAESLLQSHAGEIHLLPALPPSLGAGRVRGLVARPGVQVDLRWVDGQVREARLTARHARAAGAHRVRTAQGTTQVHLEAGTPLTLTWRPASGADTTAQEI